MPPSNREWPGDNTAFGLPLWPGTMDLRLNADAPEDGDEPLQLEHPAGDFTALVPAPTAADC